MSGTGYGRPVPLRWDQPFWDAAGESRLVGQRCRDCDRVQLYPKPACARCGASAFEWIELSGSGTVWSHAYVRQAVDEAMRDQVPFMLLDVELDEGPHLLSRLLGDAHDLAIGERVMVRFVEIAGSDRPLPFFARV